MRECPSPGLYASATSCHCRRFSDALQSELSATFCIVQMGETVTQRALEVVQSNLRGTGTNFPETEFSKCDWAYCDWVFPALPGLGSTFFEEKEKEVCFLWMLL